MAVSNRLLTLNSYMAINKNHEFEDLNGIKCAIVEKNVKPGRAAFLRELLEYNNYTVIVVNSPAPKAVAPAVLKEGEPAPAPIPSPSGTDEKTSPLMI